jgi:hypothetical protein
MYSMEVDEEQIYIHHFEWSLLVVLSARRGIAAWMHLSCIDEFVIEFKTINVPVVYMARDVMILMRGTSITMAIERWALKIETFSGP